MPVEKILNEDWSDYDNKKIADIRDGKNFSCSETWEVEYLQQKIKKQFPTLNEYAILKAIVDCCGVLRTPFPRRAFVKCVVDRLGLK